MNAGRRATIRTAKASLAVAIALCASRTARADDQPPGHAGPAGQEQPRASQVASSPERREEKRSRASPIAAVWAVVPGVVVHGSGHFAAGDPRTGFRLLAMEGAAIGVLATGFIPIVATGASRRLVGPAIGLTVAGVGLFAISALADLYGVLAPPGGTGAPLLVAPNVQTSLGYRYVYDPVFAYRNFAVYDIDYRIGSWRVHPSAWFALDDTNSRLRALGSFRFFGPRPSPSWRTPPYDAAPVASDGTYLDLQAALTRHSFTSNQFATTTGEVSLAGRLDMAKIAPSLTGSFAELAFGWALAAHDYRVARASTDVAELLLARFGYGMYIGWPCAPRGEVTVYYDHRHDGFAAGLKLPGLGSGVAGHFGAEARFYVTNRWGLLAEAVVGSAYVTGLSVLFRHGAPL